MLILSFSANVTSSFLSWSLPITCLTQSYSHLLHQPVLPTVPLALLSHVNPTAAVTARPPPFTCRLFCFFSYLLLTWIFDQSFNILACQFWGDTIILSSLCAIIKGRSCTWLTTAWSSAHPGFHWASSIRWCSTSAASSLAALYPLSLSILHCSESCSLITYSILHLVDATQVQYSDTTFPPVLAPDYCSNDFNELILASVFPKSKGLSNRLQHTHTRQA